ncbi:sigma-54-dependent transcriptional regulator [Ideonella sp.]|jgi:two-component system response regulator AtoC|uniref:sigma-54-dependent transcriptional regulator n=1 Tax=Ideonella sp. TaxID=1929293 RepID=UPI0037C0B5FE
MSHAVLIIDDEETLARNVALYLERQDYECRVAGSAEEGFSLFQSFRPDLVLLDHNLPGMKGLQALERLRTLDPQCCVVLMTGYGSVDLAVQALKAGAADYLTKPVGLAEMKLVLERLLTQDRLQRTVRYYEGRAAASSGLDKLLGQSPAMQALRAQIASLLEAERNLADDQAPAVLIRGETGTGKELVARALHFDGPRQAQPFVELNCGALPGTLIEAELFGYERGAFTGAQQRKVGLVETAEGGTLFLDEIAETEPGTQVKLLKLLEERRVRRLGGLREQAVRARIISATHQPLETWVKENRFRADLFYRLRIVELVVPPLRERGDDVMLLAQRFLDQQAARYRREGLCFDAGAQDALLRHHWPGNVRELRNTIEQAVLMARGERVTAADLGRSSGTNTAPNAGNSAGAAVVLGAEEDLDLGRMERRLIQTALARSEGNVTHAARLLGISRDTLRYRLERLGLGETH